MPNITETYWEAKGQSLHTFARSIQTIGGLALPGFRGENITIPYAPGERFVKKVPRANIITLAMWLRGVASTGGQGPGGNSQVLYQQNYNDLVRLLWNNGNQFNLTKRFYDIGSASIVQATALAEYSGGLQPTMIGKAASKCTVDLKLAEPYFYGNNNSYTLVNGDNTIEVPGNAETLNITITVNGPRNNLKIRNKTLGIEFTLPVNILTGQTAVINIRDFIAQYNPVDTPSHDVGARVINSGSPHWLKLTQGSNVIAVSSSSGTGIVTMVAKGAWV